jgi:hypothetical protein
MDVPPGFDATLVLWLNLAGTFAFGLSGGLAAVRRRLDFFGVIVLAAVVGLAGGITRDLLIGTPPATFRDWRYLVAVGAAGLVCFFAAPRLERINRQVQVFDALGLAVFCVTGASKAVGFGLGPVQAILLGAITGIGGGMPPRRDAHGSAPGAVRDPGAAGRRRGRRRRAGRSRARPTVVHSRRLTDFANAPAYTGEQQRVISRASRRRLLRFVHLSSERTLEPVRKTAPLERSSSLRPRACSSSRQEQTAVSRRRLL